MTDERGQFFEAADAPYWKRHNGIGHRWSKRPGWRRGWRRGWLMSASVALLIFVAVWLVLVVVSIAA